MSGIRFRYLRTSALSERADPILQIDNLHVRVGIRRVINNLSLSVNEGESLLVEGPNGSGKTSLFNAIAGLEPAHIESGTIRFDGKDITSDAPHERSKAGLAYLRQRDNVFLELTVKDNLHLALGEKGPEQFKARFPNWALDLPLNKNAKSAKWRTKTEACVVNGRSTEETFLTGRRTRGRSL